MSVVLSERDRDQWMGSSGRNFFVGRVLASSLQSISIKNQFMDGTIKQSINQYLDYLFIYGSFNRYG
jgi:hypothetical protein